MTIVLGLIISFFTKGSPVDKDLLSTMTSCLSEASQDNEDEDRNTEAALELLSQKQ